MNKKGIATPTGVHVTGGKNTIFTIVLTVNLLLRKQTGSDVYHNPKRAVQFLKVTWRYVC